jgi:hypothetical protein
MGYELPRGTRECQQANTKITKIRTSWDTNYHDGSWDENEPVRSSPASRDTTPPSGRAPSLEGPRGDKVDLFPPLTLHSLHCFGTLEALTAPMHLWVDVSNSVFQLFYLLQLAV